MVNREYCSRFALRRCFLPLPDRKNRNRAIRQSNGEVAARRGESDAAAGPDLAEIENAALVGAGRGFPQAVGSVPGTGGNAIAGGVIG